MTQYAMALDTHACIGCLACTLACKVENGSPEGIWCAPVIGQEFGTFPDVRRAYLPVLCNHCADAPCLTACPAGAIRRRDDGIVLIDQDRCCGSRACVIACPYGAIHFYDKRQVPKTPFEATKFARHQPGTAQKCTFCASRIDRGLQPACIDVCPTGARIFGDLEDPNSAVAKAFASSDAVALGAPVDTKPKTRYLSRGVHHAGGADADIVLAYKPQIEWGLFQTIQFGFFGLAAGVFAASRLQMSFVSFGGRRYDLGALLALLFISIGGLVLLAHLGRPFRFLNALRNWRTSWISRGAITDFAFIALTVLLLVGDSATFHTMLGAAVVLVGAIVAVYPALVLRSMGSVPAWHRAGLPWKYLIEALLMGTGVVGILGDYNVPILATMASLACTRLVIAVWRTEFEPSALVVPLASAIAILAILALAVPSLAAVVAGIAAVLAVMLSFISKRATLRVGEVQSPFGPNGELRGYGHAID
jgi:molybdopterin-containing oxidoreductase family iron-sulfur binding subunit